MSTLSRIRDIADSWLAAEDTTDGSRWRAVRFGVVLQLILFVAGILLLFQADGVKGAWGTAVSALGATLIVTAVVTLFYSMTIDSRMQKDVTRLQNCIGSLQDTVAVAQGAVDSGLAAVFANRNDPRAREAIFNALHEMAPPEEGGKRVASGKPGDDPDVRMLGISLGDYLCPHGPWKSSFYSLLQNPGIQVRMLILQDGSRNAIERAYREENCLWTEGWEEVDGDKRSVEVVCAYNPQQGADTYCPGFDEDRCVEESGDCPYWRTRCHNELKTATDVATQLAYARRNGAGDDDGAVPAVKADFEFRQYACTPMAFILIIHDKMFVENYHLAGRGGESPMMMISRYKRGTKDPSELFQIYQDHFENLWRISEPEEDQAEPQAVAVE
ncbi:MAG: hypothetical protein ACLFV7_08780 [Phycisphaerae bacterium]